MKSLLFRRLFVLLTVVAISASMAFAEKPENAKIRVNVTPSEAYIFIDGQPYAHRSHTLRLAPGEYTIGVYNYGFTPQVQKLTLKAGDNPEINARLVEVPGMVTGPWGRIQIEGNVNDKAAVFLNGTTADYFVGHIDEMNNSVLAKQRLIVPVGTYQLILVNPKETTPFFNGQVEVRANERVIVDVATKENTRTYKPWKRGEDHEPFKRFEAGTRTADIAVAPVKANIGLDKTQIACGDYVQLGWTSSEAADVVITENGKPMSDTGLKGEQKLRPLKTTTYELRATGPGGIVTQSTTVNVDTTVKTSLTATPADVTFNKVGDKVVEPGSSNLAWTAANADQVRIDPIGLVTGANGSEPLTLVPSQTGLGVVDETKTYTITATNICGGSDTQTASVHLTGAIEPETTAEVKLPQTASPLPLFGLLGLGSVLTGLGIRRFRKGR
ncbi:MAG: PEGA domain-containing protein [Candidatus Angelobacter sp.]